MITKIGVNILAETAWQQDEIIKARDQQAHYYDPFYGILGDEAIIIIRKYTDAPFDIYHEKQDINHCKILNSIIFEIQNDKGFDKKQLRKELKELVYSKFDWI